MALDPNPVPEGHGDLQVTPVDLRARVLALEGDLDSAKKELSKRVNHYESKLVTLTVINAALQNENEKLKEESAKLLNDSETYQDLTDLQEEFSKRLGVAERTALNMKVECITLRQQIEDLKKGKELLTTELEDKQSSIEQYAIEGEKLSIKIGELESTTKRYRADLVKSQQEKEIIMNRVKILEGAAKELEQNRSVVVAESNHVLQQAQQALEETRKKAEEELVFTRDECAVQISRLSQNIEEREKLLAANLDALRTSLTKAAETASEREDALREEMKGLEERCRTAEAAQEEATAHLSEATMPIMRQISLREAVMEEREQQQSCRLHELEDAAKTAVESLRNAETGTVAAIKRAEVAESVIDELKEEVQCGLQKLQELTAMVLRSEEKLATAEKAQEDLKERLLLAQERVACAEKAQEEAAERFLSEQAAKEEAERQLEEVKLELQAEADGMRLEFQSLKASLAEQEREFRARMTLLRTASLGENNADTGRIESTPSTPKTVCVSISKEFSTKKQASSRDFVPDVNEIDLSKGGLSPTPVHMERLASEVRRLQGEVVQLHRDLKATLSARDHASEDLLKATEKLNILEKDRSSANKVKKDLEELKQRHEMALLIIGEQNEKSEELEADISDVKTLYREQMNLLISQIDPQKWPDGYRICLFCSHCAQVQRQTKRGSFK